MVQELLHQATPVEFEPTRGDPIGLAGRRLSRSAKVSLLISKPYINYMNQLPEDEASKCTLPPA